MNKSNGKVFNKPKTKISKSIVSNISGLKLTPYVDNGLRYPIDILEFKRVNESEIVHSTQKPIDLIKYLIQSYSKEDDIVLDFTMGSGTTLVGCVELNRKGIGIEKDSFKIAVDRIQKAIDDQKGILLK